jgi:alpha-beta hydrolase superfamily lysophospholipase
VNKRIFWRWAKVLALLYGVVGIVLYHTQRFILWHPVAVPLSTVYDFGSQPFTEVNIPYDKTTNLDLIKFRATDRPADSAAKGVVLYFHGNGGNVEHYSVAATNFTRNGYECWLWDYPGFGKSTGELGEQQLYDYALVLYKMARSRWPPLKIILYGSSMGTGIAAELADIRDCRLLVLESPFYSLESLAYRRLPIYPWGRMLRYHFPTNLHLPNVTAPVIIFHGTEDGTIPYANALRLKPLLKPGDLFIPIDGAGHNDLRNFPLYREKLDSLLTQ